MSGGHDSGVSHGVVINPPLLTQPPTICILSIVPTHPLGTHDDREMGHPVGALKSGLFEKVPDTTVYSLYFNGFSIYIYFFPSFIFQRVFLFYFWYGQLQGGCFETG